jgi:tetratricopeptide (TPR) repeat protein
MTPSPLLDGLAEVSAALTADVRGQLRDTTHPELGQREAAAAAAAVSELSAAGGALGLARLEVVVVKGAGGALATAVRADELLHVRIDPSRGTAQAERALHAWASFAEASSAQAGRGAGAAPPAPSPASSPPARTAGANGVTAPAPSARAAPPSRAAAPPADTPREARAAPREDPWAGLRRALSRGLLTQAAARRRELGDGPPGTRAGAEPVAPAEIDRALQLLLQGAGSALAGDGVGALRTLEPLAEPSQRNLSFRWLALYWSGRAALRSGNSAAARGHLKQALALAKQLDLDAVALSHWVAAQVLAHDGDHARALAFLAHARSGFQRLGDGWGLGQCWLAEGRVQVALGREQEAVAAARQASAAAPEWDEPALFLARRAIARDDLAEADELLRDVRTPSADRVRALLQAMRERIVDQAGASEFLRESDAPPTARSIRAMRRIAEAAPGFVQAREALAWMLLKVGQYGEASAIFRELLGQQLSQADRASVMLGLGCIAHAQQNGQGASEGLQAAIVAAGGAAEGAEPAEPPPLAATARAAQSSQLAAGSAVFSGQLSVFALPDVIEFVRSARRTGLLVCSSEDGVAALHFRDGRIAGASSPGAPDLGELLTGARLLSSVALRAARAAGPEEQPDHALGARLVEDGLVEAGAVREALRRKIEVAILELMRWREGQFAFNRDGDGRSPRAESPLEFDAQDVLLNVIRQMDESARGAAEPSLH